ncbi:unnamed protein product [Arabidopsis halleri]
MMEMCILVRIRIRTQMFIRVLLTTMYMLQCRITSDQGLRDQYVHIVVRLAMSFRNASRNIDIHQVTFQVLRVQVNISLSLDHDHIYSLLIPHFSQERSTLIPDPNHILLLMWCLVHLVLLLMFLLL